jgi:hypothetical protein
MFKETLLITPKLAAGDLNKMEQTLSRRFGNVAKKFGKGLASSLAGGGLIGAAVGLVDKILNPLKETQDAIDRTLKAADDLVTNAKQFGTTSGKLFRLQQLGKSTGLDEGSLDLLISKFQAAVAEAEADPNKSTAVRAFVGETDIASAFFEFIQSLQKMEKNQQIRVQQEVFGEKQILKMADFLGTDFEKQVVKIFQGLPSSQQMTKRIDNAGGLNDLKDELEARRASQDMFAKGGAITESMIRAQDQRAKLDLQRENKQIQSYNDLAAISNSANEILNLVKEGVLGLTGMLVKVTDMANNVRKFSESRAVKGFLKWSGGN